MPRTSRLRIAVVASVALLAACGSDSGVAPDAAPDLTLEHVFNQMTVPSISALSSLGGAVNVPPGRVGGVPTGCSFAAASQSFDCPPVTNNGLTATQSYILLNASGGSLSQFDASAVAAVRVRASVVGTHTINGSTFTLQSQHDRTLSGLQTNTHTLNGTMITTGQRVGAGTTGGPQFHTSDSSTTVTKLVLPAAGSATSYPKSGTITSHMRVTYETTPALDLGFVMLFDGSSKVRVTSSRDGVIVSICTIDLASKAPICA